MILFANDWFLYALSFISKIFTKYWNVMQTISSAKFEVIFLKHNLSHINAIWHISQKKSLAIWSFQDYQNIKVYIFCSPLLSFLISLVDKVVWKTPTRLCKKKLQKVTIYDRHLDNSTTYTLPPEQYFDRKIPNLEFSC